jgi:hypothetical protein
MWRRYAFDKLSKFWSSVTSTEDSEHLGHPRAIKSDDNVNQAEQLVLRNRRTIIHEVVNMLQISSGSVQNILKENVNTRPTVAKCLLCLLSEKQENCVNTCQDLLKVWKRPRIPFGDNHRYNTETKHIISEESFHHLHSPFASKL